MPRDVKKLIFLVVILFPLVSWNATDTLTVTITIQDALDVSSELPKQFRLNPPYPNPFNSRVVFNLDIPRTAEIKLQIVDLKGRLIQTLVSHTMIAGRHQLMWHPSSQISSGLYLVVLRSQTYNTIKKILYLK